MSGSVLAIVIASFLASGVEAVEALTIVLAAGVTRGWRSTLIGVGSALLVLAALTAVLGPALSRIPINGLRLVVGALLLVFGLQWLRKAILRASGYKELHDEAAIYQRNVVTAQTEASVVRAGLDWYAFTLSFKGVLLEGLEVIFIVLTFGATANQIGLAAVGAAAAVVLVTAVGVVVHQPLTRVPENTLKFAVGLLLSSFGTFWAAEGAGVSWPGSDLAILGILAVLVLTSFAYVAVLRRWRATRTLRLVA
ncbi:MAG: TMEM165/GDT1 family protein [Chloroflexi bacterium]|nr:TMEM165/GDT1 family protein [Chloroflexota bacterium]